MLKVFEIVPFWPAEVFIQRHLTAFPVGQFQPQIFTRITDYTLRSSSILSETDLRANELPRFDGLSVFEKAKKAASLWNEYDLLFEKRSWEDKLLLRYFRRNKPDLIHFHWTNLAVRLSWIPLELKIPFTFSMRGHDVQERMLDPKYIEGLSKVIKCSSGIHSVCEYIWHEAASLCDIDKSSVFHKTIYTTVPIASVKKTLEAKAGSYVFVTTGRLHWRKNFVGLLIAFKRLLAEGLDAKLIIVGDGDLKECLGYWTKFLDIMDSVSFTGTLPYSEIMALLEHSDAYIQSSIAEGFSNSLAEAMALGMPVFATEVGGTQEIIKDSENGYLLDPEHPENWWEKLILISDQEKMRAIGAQAWNDACEKFSAQTHAAQFKDFYYKSSGILNESDSMLTQP